MGSLLCGITLSRICQPASHAERSAHTRLSNMPSRGLSPSHINDVNLISSFLSHSSATPLSTPSNPTYVLAGNAILPTAYALFKHLKSLPAAIPVTLVITGGIGHSTHYLYSAMLSAHPDLFNLNDLHDIPEAKVLELLLRQSYSSLVSRPNFQLLIEPLSTNCGSNATETFKLLDDHGIRPGRLVVVQDPTMMRRTLACFEKVFGDDKKRTGRQMPELVAWATFTPRLRLSGDGEAEWDIQDYAGSTPIRSERLWDLKRFLDLLMGEIPRMRDDETGYGPRGKGFITHIEIPLEVEKAWGKLREVVEYER